MPPVHSLTSSKRALLVLPVSGSSLRETSTRGARREGQCESGELTEFLSPWIRWVAQCQDRRTVAEDPRVKTFGLVFSRRLKDRHVVGGVFGGKCPILQVSGGEDRVGGWDVWVRPPRRAASQPGSRDRWGGEAAQWPQFERSPIQIGGGADTGEENSAGGRGKSPQQTFVDSERNRSALSAGVGKHQENILANVQIFKVCRM